MQNKNKTKILVNKLKMCRMQSASKSMFSMLIMHINMFVDVKHGTVMVSHAKTGFLPRDAAMLARSWES